MSKMQGLSVKLPLTYSKQDGPYALNKDLGEVVKQNLKNLILTSPGERVMMPGFGVGVRRFLFEQMSSDVFNRLTSEIYQQVNTHMSFVNIEDVRISTFENNPDLGLNEVRLSIEYNLGSLGGTNTLQISQVND